VVSVRASLFIVLLLAATSSAAFELTLDRRAIEQAIGIGKSHIERDRVQLHAAYRLAVSRAPIDYIDVVTPFRRVVLAAEVSAQTGDRSFGQRQALELLAVAPGQVDFWIELTFHPLNVYVGVPEYEVVLVAGDGTAIRPRNLDRVPRFGPRIQGPPLPYPAPIGGLIQRRSEPMLGGTVIASFDGRLLDQAAAYDVVVSEEGKEIAKARVPLSAMR
jgi:hypothetical protein